MCMSQLVYSKANAVPVSELDARGHRERCEAQRDARGHRERYEAFSSTSFHLTWPRDMAASQRVCVVCPVCLCCVSSVSVCVYLWHFPSVSR